VSEPLRTLQAASNHVQRTHHHRGDRGKNNVLTLSNKNAPCQTRTAISRQVRTADSQMAVINEQRTRSLTMCRGETTSGLPSAKSRRPHGLILYQTEPRRHFSSARRMPDIREGDNIASQVCRWRIFGSSESKSGPSRRTGSRQFEGRPGKPRSNLDAIPDKRFNGKIQSYEPAPAPLRVFSGDQSKKI